VLLFAAAATTYTFFQDTVPDDADGVNACSTKLKCLMFVLSEGMRAGGGLGDAMELDYTSSTYVERVFFDLIYFLVCVIIMLAIVSGIIIDAFGASRDEQTAVKDDQEGCCFICGIETSRFDALPKGFHWHVGREHNMWTYIYFLAYLKSKPSTELTGVEQYVYERVHERDISWFPIERSLMLEAAGVDISGDDDDDE
jgi:hypothetical protein